MDGGKGKKGKGKKGQGKEGKDKEAKVATTGSSKRKGQTGDFYRDIMRLGVPYLQKQRHLFLIRVTSES